MIEPFFSLIKNPMGPDETPHGTFVQTHVWHIVPTSTVYGIFQNIDTQKYVWSRFESNFQGYISDLFRHSFNGSFATLDHAIQNMEKRVPIKFWNYAIDPTPENELEWVKSCYE